MTRWLAILLLVLPVPGAVARARVSELMERAVLPLTPAVPTCACVVDQGGRDQLVVGLANGDIVVFHETAGDVFARMGSLPGAGPVDAVAACRQLRPGGSGTEFVLLAIQGRQLFSVAFEDMSVTGRVTLPAPAGAYRLEKVRQRSDGAVGGAAGFDRAVAFDEDSMMRITQDTRSSPPVLGVESILEGAEGLCVTVLSDRIAAAAGDRIVEFLPSAEGMSRSVSREEYASGGVPVSRVAAGATFPDGTSLEVLSALGDSAWISSAVTLPGSCSVVVPVADTLLAAGGAAAMTPDHDVGWVALISGRGRIIARRDHARPVTSIARLGHYLAVQGDRRNLSLYDMRLRPLWDHDSPVEAVAMLGGDFAGDASNDLAVVGIREFAVSSAQVDSIRKYLDEPGFMAEAAVGNEVARLRRPFITYYVSSALELRQMMLEGTRDAADAIASGDPVLAVERATAARAAAATLGRDEEVGSLTTRIADYVSLARRRRSLLLGAAVLALLGAWCAVDHVRGTLDARSSVLAATALFAVAAAVWLMLGRTGLNPLLLIGGGAVVGGQVTARTGLGARARAVPGAAIEDLIRALMEFLHGAGEGVPSEGVVDAARKSVTKVAYLAQEMSDSMDDDERYRMLRERFRTRGEDFLDMTYPRVVHLLSLARRAGFIVSEVERLARAAERMRTAIVTVLSEPAPAAPIVRQQLEALRDGREALAAAADRAWAVVQSNPGCSLTRGVDRIAREKRDELAAAGARVEVRHSVSPTHDAVALWAFQLRFILENLVTNAIGAVSESRSRVITIETEGSGGMCTIRVSDTGCGMTEDRAREIFRPRAEERDGGYGLSNSRALLQERGGDLTVERTAPGAGTTFLLSIPHWTPNTGGP